MISQLHIIFEFLHIIFIFLSHFRGSGPRSGPQQSYFCHIPGHFFSILFQYYCENLVSQPAHADIIFTTHPEPHPAKSYSTWPGAMDHPLDVLCRKEGTIPPPLLEDNQLHHKLALAKARAIYEC